LNLRITDTNSFLVICDGFLSDVSGDKESLESQKERVFRALQRDADEETQQLSNIQQQSSMDASDSSSTVGTIKRHVFSTSDLLRSIAFGSCVGAITGSVFGFVDSMRSAAESPFLRQASNASKSKYLIDGTMRSGTLFGAFFAGFHTIKYGIRTTLNDPGAPTEIAVASVISLGAMTARASTRSSLPYAFTLVAMDTVSLYLKDER
jgi:hypothetical protein